MSSTESEDANVQPLTLEKLLASTKHQIARRLVLETDAGEETFEVKFRRLSYNEIIEIDSIPKDQPKRYVQTVVQLGSLQPKFESTEQICNVPTGFVRSYAALILAESGKDPFLKKK